MTTVLNRKFDLLCHSGTCPSYLVDVLSLLVAHANDTELFKSELRTSGGSGGSAAAPAGLQPSRGPSAVRFDPSSREATERSAADRRTQLMYRQVEDPDALDDALRASHESVLIAAEQSLQTYAEDLKHMNEIAMATSAKQLRAMRVETQQQMEAFRDRVCAGVVVQTKDELEVMRSEFGVAVKEDASALVRELHDVSLAAQRQVQELTSSFADFVAHTSETTVAVPLGEAHEALAAVAFMEERVNGVEAAAASQADVQTLEGRLRELERIVAALGTVVSSPLPSSSPGADNGGWEKSSRQASSTAAAFSSSATDAGVAAPAGESRRSSSNTAHPTAVAKPSSRPPSRPLATDRPARADVAASTSPAAPPPPPQQASAAVLPSQTCAERLGVAVESAEEGVVLTEVVPDSIAAQHQLGAGHIISHVGRVAVTDPAVFETALEASEGQALKLTTYDPFQGRIRVLTIQPS